MADDIDVKDAADVTVTVAGDSIDGKLFQRIKLIHGADGVNDGDVASGNPLPVDATGSIVVVSDGGSSITVDNGGTFAVQAAQSGTWNIGTVTTITNVVHVDDNSGSLTVDNGGTFAVQGTAKGTIAEDSAASDAPVVVGGRATSTNLSPMSTDGDVVRTQHTMQGALVTADAPRALLGNQQTQLSNSTSEVTIVTAVSGVYNDLYGLILANTGASATKVSIRDDTAGTVIAIIYVPASDTRGFMLPAGSALSQTATNKNWTAQCGTATTALEVTALFVKRK